MPPSRDAATRALRIDGFVRPLTVKACKEMLAESGGDLKLSVCVYSTARLCVCTDILHLARAKGSSNMGILHSATRASFHNIVCVVCLVEVPKQPPSPLEAGMFIW